MAASAAMRGIMTSLVPVAPILAPRLPGQTRNSASERLMLTIAASSRRPKEGPILSARKGMALSIITQEGTRSPSSGVCSTRTRSSGPSAGSEVSSSTVRERM